MITLRGLGRQRRVFCALVWGAALVLVASAGAADWLQKEEGGYRTYYWNTFLNPKFQYNLSTSQWWHWSSVGSSWYTLSSMGRPDTFIGDGASHDLGNGFTYSYVTAYDSCWFVKGYAGRFTYAYTPGQWKTYSSFGGWYNLGNAGLSASFMGDGAYHNLGNGFTYCYTAGWDSGWFVKGYAGRFTYAYTPGQWKTYSSFGGWYNLGNAGLSVSFMGDGASHTLGNGFTYSYFLASDSGWFVKGSAGRFSYLYGPGQWRTYSSYGGWQSLGSAGLSVSFMGDGSRHDLGNDFGFQYDIGTDLARWYGDRLGFYKFAYAYTAGQWYDRDKYGNQYALGGAGTAVGEFMGDGSVHVLDATWSYRFDGRAGFWLTGGADRFSYQYDIAAWFDYPVWGSMYQLGASGRTAAFIGDGSSRTLGNGWWYAYDSGLNEASWARSDTGPTRFSYDYADGQWYHHYVGVGYALGALHQDSRFRGDGARHGVVGGTAPWYYAYDYNLDRGTWQRTSTALSRFAYAYTDGQWYHFDEWGAHALGAAGLLPSSFMGSGTRYDVTNGGSTWWYDYMYATDRGEWSLNDTSPVIFSFGYVNGQWYHHDSAQGWALGPAGRSVAPFMGSGELFDVTIGSNRWWYRYEYGGLGTWYTSPSSGAAFAYAYGAGQWFHYDYDGSDVELGPTGYSLAAFIGDGQLHNISLAGGDQWAYSYDYGRNVGYWKNLDNDRTCFTYDYADGQWYHLGSDLREFALGSSHQGLEPFIGGGGWVWYASGLQWAYQYDYSTDTGYWTRDVGLAYRFSYDYANGRWTDYPAIGSTYQLGADARSSEFIGCGASVDLGIWNGRQWYYTYGYTADEGSWARDTTASGIRFSYDYPTGQWYQHNAFGSYDRYALGAVGAAASDYIGNGSWYQISGVPDWWYSYDMSASDTGRWSRDGGASARFSYDYGNARWWDNFTDFGSVAYQLGVDGTSAQFIADGTYRELGPWNGGTWWFKYNYTESPIELAQQILRKP